MIKKYTKLVGVFPGNLSGGHLVSFLTFIFPSLEKKGLSAEKSKSLSKIVSTFPLQNGAN